MLEVEAASTIRRPRAEVAAAMFDPRQHSAWIGGVTGVRLPFRGPLYRGARFEQVVRHLGRRAVLELRVEAHVRERSVTFTRPARPHSARPDPARPDPARPDPARPDSARPDWQVRYALEAIPEGTIARIYARRPVPWVLRPLAPLLARRLRRAVARDLDGLKRLVESGAFRRPT